MSRIPIPQSLEKECIKGSKILDAFIKPGTGVDKMIPRNILERAKGIAFLTVIKAGFIWSGRLGSGLVVARLPDGRWSAPSAIGTAGAGVGGQIGAEVTDFVMVLTTESAVKAFSHGGNLTLGANVAVAAGPVGRSAEASGAILNLAPVLSYSKSKGLFAGVSLEGSVILERKDANKALYGRPVRAQDLMSGAVPPPPQADVLYRQLNLKIPPLAGTPLGAGTDYSGNDPYGGSGRNSPEPGPVSGSQSYLNRTISHSGHSATGVSPGYGGATTSAGYGAPSNYGVAGSSSFKDSNSNYGGASSNYGANSNYGGGGNLMDEPSHYNDTAPPYDNRSNDYHGSQPAGDTKRRPPPPPPPAGSSSSHDQVRAVALYDFTGEQSDDLPFTKGDIIIITKKTEDQNSWWEGTCNGKSGNFPGNYVRLD